MSQPIEFDQIKVGTVLEDSYDNPAVVVSIQGTRITVMQTVGSDRGRTTRPGMYLREVTGAQAERALDVARDEWRKQHARR